MPRLATAPEEQVWKGHCSDCQAAGGKSDGGAAKPCRMHVPADDNQGGASGMCDGNVCWKEKEVWEMFV